MKHSPRLPLFIFLQAICAAAGAVLISSHGGRLIFYGFLALSCVITGIMDVFVYALIKKASQSRALEERVRVAADQLKIQESYFQELTAEVQKYRKLRHDQINYLNALLGLINMGEADKAKELLHERIGSYHSTAAGYCRNLVVDSILSANKSVASANDIEYLIDVILEEDLGIDRIDLCGVFGNILDNAVTACKEVASGRLIMLSAAVKGGCLVIRCKNTKANEIKFSKGKPLSTKGPDHGLGLTILEDIAKKYDGSFNIVCDDQYFQITVFLMCGAVNSAPLKLS